MASWIDAVVRCPMDLVNVSAAHNASNMSLSVVHDGHPSIAALLRILLEEDDGSSSSSWSGASGGGVRNASEDVFPYASTTILYGLLALQSLVFCVWILWRFHGVRVYATRPSDARLRSASRRHGSLFHDNTTFATEEGNIPTPTDANAASPYRDSTPLLKKQAAVAGPPQLVRRVTPSTNNVIWAIYFGMIVVLRLISTGTLVFAANYSERDNQEALRIAWLIERCVHGGSCVFLAVALNVQRLHRVKDHKNAVANQALLRQATLVNRFCFCVFVVFSIGDFVASHTTAKVSSAATALYWTSIASLFVLAVPTVVSTAWVVLHVAPLQPSKFAKTILSFGVAMHTVVMLPPSFWNSHVLATFVTNDPCPMRYLSFYDMLLAFHIVTTALLFVFVVMEHRRTSAIVIRDYLASCEERLQRRMLQDGSIQRSTTKGAKPQGDAIVAGGAGGQRRSAGGGGPTFRTSSGLSTARSMSTVPTPVASSRRREESSTIPIEQLDDAIFISNDVHADEEEEDEDYDDFDIIAAGELNGGVGSIGVF